MPLQSQKIRQKKKSWPKMGFGFQARSQNNKEKYSLTAWSELNEEKPLTKEENGF